MALEQTVRKVRCTEDLLALLREELDWPLVDSSTVEESTFEWTMDELRVKNATAVRLKGGVIRQIRPFTEAQPWGIFLIEFADGRVYRTALRDVLRRLVPNRRREAALPSWSHDNLLFICTARDSQTFTFAHFRGEGSSRPVLTTFGWEADDTHIRTLCEFNLERLMMPSDPHDKDGWLCQWQSAFDVQRVSDDFFKNYEQLFHGEVKPAAKKALGSEEEAHNYTQMLLNRLMFCWFLQKKGWLAGKKDYLINLLKRACSHPEQRNFLHDYLDFLFFEVLANPQEERRKRTPGDPHIVWEAPFLNGGLFEASELDEKMRRVPPLKRIPNTVFKAVLEGLLARYNFTVEESTSLDRQVALGPELLGTIFERLVTGRHETGSYYTPRPVVEFMCREALTHYLISALGPGWKNRRKEIEDFVYNGNAEAIGAADAPEIIRALDEVRVCDPACGSGAYLVTMLHELVALYHSLYSAKLTDAKKDYDLKLRIIQQNLYGVDIDPFAVNIARLRLWLSLVFDDERTDWRQVDPLPNLDFKIEVGDSLTAPLGAVQKTLRHDVIQKFQQKKGEYMVAHGEEKGALREEIEVLRKEMADWLHAGGTAEGFDWAVEFAEVFEPSVPAVTIGGALNSGYELAYTAKPGGFDIVITNPPYLRQEVVKRQFGDAYKAKLIKLYPDCCMGTSDIYVAFYARACQLLRFGGIGCFISSNKWLRAAYGEKLRQFLLDGQAFHLAVDFGELPVFQAATFPGIFLWQKQPRDGTATWWATVKDLDECYREGIKEHVARIGQSVPARQFGPGRARLASAAAAEMSERMEASGPRLGELVKGKIFRGVLTGLNAAFIIDRETRNRLIAEDPRSAEIIKPLLVGDDVRRYEVHFRERYLIWTYVGVPIEVYPAVMRHIERFQEAAEKRWDKGNYWWELRNCDYYEVFEHPKIVYPEIAMEPRFAFDVESVYPLNTVFSTPVVDLYLLGILNSRHAWEYLKIKCSVLGDSEQRGRLRLKAIYVETLPIPDACDSERWEVARLAESAHRLHGQRWKRVEQFLRDIGSSPAESSSRNPLEEPWRLSREEFLRRAMGVPVDVFAAARDETTALTEEIEKIEREIDERVAALYGL